MNLFPCSRLLKDQMSNWSDVSANWSDLPYQMLVEIVERLREPKDFVGFGAVCKSWTAAAKKENFKGLWLLQDTPYLMLPAREGNVDIREFYSLVEGGIVESLRVPKFKDCKCFESLGWLLALGEDVSMCLLNPFTGTEIPLPRQTIFEPEEVDSYPFIQKMVLSSRPDETSDYIVMVICGSSDVLAFWRPGDQTWKKIDVVYHDGHDGAHHDVVYGHDGAYHDVVYHDGRFYAVNCYGFVRVFDVVGNDVKEGRIITRLIYNEFVSNPALYILKVFGSLLVIARKTRHFDEANDKWTYNTSEFKVYEVDELMGTWKEINNLGSVAVFIGHSSTTAVDASRFPGIIKPNHIYFTDDGTEAYFFEEKGGGKDMGVYNLETETIEPFYSGELLLSKISPSFWITPHF